MKGLLQSPPKNKKQQLHQQLFGFFQKNKNSSTTNNNSTTTARTPTSMLYDLCIEMKWEKVIQHCSQYPIDAYYIDNDTNETCLYVSCQNNSPLHVIKLLINTNPYAIYFRCGRNRTIPLHVACQYYTISYTIIHLLLFHQYQNPNATTATSTTMSSSFDSSFYSTASQPDIWGCTPLLKLLNGRISHSRSFLVTNTSTGNNNNNNSTTNDNNNNEIVVYQPFDNIQLDNDDDFFKKIDIILQAIALYRIEQQTQSQSQSQSQTQKQSQSPSAVTASITTSSTSLNDVQAVKTATRTMSNVYQHNNVSIQQQQHQQQKVKEKEEKELLLLHALVSLRSNNYRTVLLQYCIIKYKHQLSIRDSTGQLPLHIVLGPNLGQYVQVNRLYDNINNTYNTYNTYNTNNTNNTNTNNFFIFLFNNNNSKNNCNKQLESQWHWTNRTSSQQQRPFEKDTVRLLLQYFPQSAYYCCDTSTITSIQYNYTNTNNNEEHNTTNSYNYYCFPLHVALHNNHTWYESSLDHLVYAAPEIVTYRDPITGLYPFMIPVAILDTNATTITNSNSGELKDLTTTFELLRFNPAPLCNIFASLTEK